MFFSYPGVCQKILNVGLAKINRYMFYCCFIYKLNTIYAIHLETQNEYSCKVCMFASCGLGGNPIGGNQNRILPVIYTRFLLTLGKSWYKLEWTTYAVSWSQTLTVIHLVTHRQTSRNTFCGFINIRHLLRLLLLSLWPEKQKNQMHISLLRSRI